MPSSLLFSQRLPNLLGGLSQAPDALKQPNEFTTMDNIMVDPLVGLRKRPGTFHLASLRAYGSDLDTAHYHHINRTDSERYVVVTTDGDLKVYDAITGAEQTVLFPDGKAYLGVSAGNKMRATTVGDSTYYVNREVTVSRDHETYSSTLTREAFVTILATGEYQFWEITLDGEFLYVSSEDDSGHKPNKANQTAMVASAFVTGFGRHEQFSDFSVDVYGSTLHIRRTDGGSFHIKGRDSFGGNGMRIVKGVVQSTEELPASAPVGTILKVSGQGSSELDDYWVKAHPADREDVERGTTVLWKETTAPGILTELDASTMPHVLVRALNYLEDVYAHSTAWPYPYISSNVLSTDSFGWGYDLSGATMDAAATRIITDNGDGGMTDLSTAVLPEGRAKATWNWSIDCSSMPIGHSAKVHIELLSDTGTVVYENDFIYQAGEIAVSQTDSVDFDSSKQCKGTITLTHDVGETPGGSNYPRLALFGAKWDPVGFVVDYYDKGYITVGAEGQMFPSQMHVAITADAATCEFTLGEDMDASALATLIATELAASASGVTCSVINGASDGEPCVVSIQIDAVRPPVDFSGTYSMDEYTAFWSPDLNLERDALSGMELHNLTSGAQGVVSSNTETAIYLAAGLTGGTRSYFQEGDQIVVKGVGTSTWIFKEIEWGKRTVGNLKQSPWPSFEGERIQDIGFHKNRMVLVAENKAILSAHGDPYRFFRKTTTAVLDDDPIDITAAAKDATVFESVVEWNKMLVLSTTMGVQYSLTGTPVLSPNTVVLDRLSGYMTSDYIRPYTLGGSLVFAQRKGDYSIVREIFEGIYGRLETHVLTEKVPQLIVGDVVGMAGDPDLGILACIVNDASHRAYLYVWRFKYNQTGELLVSAWGQWFLQHSNRIYSIDIHRGRLTLLTKSWPDDLNGELGTGPAYLALEYMELSRPPSDSEQYADRQGASGGASSINARLKLPVLYRRTADGVSQTEGRTQVRRLKVDYLDSQQLSVTVDPAGPATVKSTGIPGATSTSTEKHTGTLHVPVLCENTQVSSIEMINTTKTGFTITGIEWEAFFHSRNQRV